MPDEVLNLPHTAKDPPPPKNPSLQAQKPSIRTMHADIEELLKTTKPTLGQMIQESRHGAPPFAEGGRKRFPFLLIILLLIVLGGGGAAWFFVPRFIAAPAPLPAAPGPTQTPLAVPRAPLFATEAAVVITLDTTEHIRALETLETTLLTRGREGTVERITIRLREPTGEHFANLLDFLTLYRINPPVALRGHLHAPLTLFVLHTAEGNELGLAAQVIDPERVLRDFLLWEPSLGNYLTPLFLRETLTPATPLFEDRTYRNIDWRYLRLSAQKDIGVAYGIFPAGNVLLITTGKASMETAINRLFDAR